MTTTPDELLRVAVDLADRIRAKVRLITRNEADAEDVLSDTYVRLVTYSPTKTAEREIEFRPPFGSYVAFFND